MAVLLGLLAPPAVEGRGLHLEPAPWYGPSRPDSGLSLQVGATYVDADTQASIFPITLATIRRGPLEFAASWSYVVVRTAQQHVFALGDPKVFTRLRITAFGDSVAPTASLFGEFIARIPTAQNKLFPYATGGQELELTGTLALYRPAHLHVGLGYIWAEPPSRSTLGSNDIPGATHAWLRVERQVGNLVLSARMDGLFFEIKDVARGICSFGLAHWTPEGFDVSLEFGFETSDERERIFNHLVSLRFATPLR